MLVLPYSLYFDVTQYGGKAAAGRQQGVLVVSVRNLLTKKRHRVATIRKGMFCKCGCHGDCTVAMLELFLHWCAKALANGTFPDCDLNNQPLNQAYRASMAGHAMGFKGAICIITNN